MADIHRIFFPFSRYPPDIRRMVDIRLLSYGYVLSVYRVLSSEQLILISGLSPLIGFPKRHKCWTRTWSSIIKNENPITGLSGRSDSTRPGFRKADIRRNPLFWLKSDCSSRSHSNQKTLTCWWIFGSVTYPYDLVGPSVCRPLVIGWSLPLVGLAVIRCHTFFRAFVYYVHVEIE